MTNKQLIDELDLEKKRLENKKLELEIEGLTKKSSIKIQNWDLLLKAAIAISAIISAILLKGVVDKEKAGLNSEKSILKAEILEFESRKKVLNDSLFYLNDSIGKIDSIRRADFKFWTKMYSKLEDSIKNNGSASEVIQFYKRHIDNLRRFTIEGKSALLLEVPEYFVLNKKIVEYKKESPVDDNCSVIYDDGFYMLDGQKLNLEVYLEKDKKYTYVFFRHNKAKVDFGIYQYATFPSVNTLPASSPPTYIQGEFPCSESGTYHVEITQSKKGNQYLVGHLLIFSRDNK